MKAKICEKTWDLYLILSSENAKFIKKTPDGVEYDTLIAHDKGYHFWLAINNPKYNTQTEDITIQVPEFDMLKNQAWHIRITEKAYQKLLKLKRIGIDYLFLPQRSKLNIIIDDELASS